MTNLENQIFDLRVNPEKGYFSIFTKEARLPDVENARLGVIYSCMGKKVSALFEHWGEYQVYSSRIDHSEHGLLETMTFVLPAREDGVGFELTFGIVQDYPLVVWKVKVLNQGNIPVQIEKIVLMKVDASASSSKVVFADAKLQSEMGFFSNGWQSWSPVGWVAGDGKMPRTRLGGLQAPMIYNTGTPIAKKRGHFSSDFFAVFGDRLARNGFVLGFLAQKEHFGSIEADFNLPLRLCLWANGDDARLDPGKSIETDWAVFNPVLLDHSDPLGKYFEAVSRENYIHVPQDSPVGWCSWYHFYTNLSAQDVRANLKTIVDGQEQLPIQLVQIDDGFESQVGDWFSFKPTFPDGVKTLAEEISHEGLIPGLWLAPFIIHPKSQVYREHPDWILRRPNGKPVNAGYVWGTLDTALDLTVPEALEYACRVVKTAAHEWGYPYLKLDFLYAAALPGKYQDPTLTRAQVLRKGMEAIRAAVGPQVTLLGCGAPFGPMLGLVEAMRIGPDVSGDWVPRFNGIEILIKNEPSFPCARNSIRNILTRANLHKQWWINDPDCLLIRPDTRLTLAEVQSLATVIGVTGGSLLLSDDLPKLPAERLRIAEVLLPIIGDRARVLDWFDSEMPTLLRLDMLNDTGEWHLVAKFNWQDRPVDFSLTPKEFALTDGDYWVSDFWQGKSMRLTAGGEYCVEAVPAHGCVLCTFRKAGANDPLYLGSDLHYSMGNEIAEWKSGRNELSFTVRLPRNTSGKVVLWLPWEAGTVSVNDLQSDFSKFDNGTIEIPVHVNGFAHIKIHK